MLRITGNLSVILSLKTLPYEYLSYSILIHYSVRIIQHGLVHFLSHVQPTFYFNFRFSVFIYIYVILCCVVIIIFNRIPLLYSFVSIYNPFYLTFKATLL